MKCSLSWHASSPNSVPVDARRKMVAERNMTNYEVSTTRFERSEIQDACVRYDAASHRLNGR
jgi:hypothetical protein